MIDRVNTIANLVGRYLRPDLLHLVVDKKVKY